MKHFFAILGGMGTAATESYLRLLNQRTPAHRDQEYLNYVLINHATVPDRTAHILDAHEPSFLPALAEDVTQYSHLKPDFFVMVCNTAHYYYKNLTQLTTVPFVHMPDVAVDYLRQRYPEEQRVGLIATKGTIADHVYEQALTQRGCQVVLGDDALQAEVQRLIYDDIKIKGQVNAKRYHAILARVTREFGVNVIVLGCTELSLAQEKAADHPYRVIDAQSIIADQTLNLALALRQGQELDWSQVTHHFYSRPAN